MMYTFILARILSYYHFNGQATTLIYDYVFSKNKIQAGVWRNSSTTTDFRLNYCWRGEKIHFFQSLHGNESYANQSSSNFPFPFSELRFFFFGFNDKFRR